MGIEKIQTNNVRNDTRSLIQEFKKGWGKYDEAKNPKVKEELKLEDHVSIKEEDFSLKQNLKEIRSEQLSLGHFIKENYKEIVEEEDKPKLQEKRKLGRPAKLEEEKVQFVAMKFPPSYISFLKSIKGEQGFGLKLRKIIDEYRGLKKREETQIALVKKYIEKIDKALGIYIKTYERSYKLEENNGHIEDIGRQIKDLGIILNILSYTISDLQNILSQKEFNTLTFSLHWNENRKG